MYSPTIFLAPLLFAVVASLATHLIFALSRARVRDYVDSHPALYAFVSRLALPKRIDWIATIAIIVAMIGFPLNALHQYLDFGSFRDNVDFDISLWNLLNGGSIESIVNFSRRFNPILLALVPLYSLWSDPRILLIFQSVGIASAALPLYWFARKTIGRALGLMITLAYLAYPSIYALNHQAIFYEIKLAIPVFSFAIYFLLIRKYIPFFACLLVALFIKQEIALIAVGFALFLLFIQRKGTLGISLAAIGVIVALFVIFVLYPGLNEGRIYPQFEERYSYLGTTLDQVILSLWKHPSLVVQHILTRPKIDFVATLLTPLSLLPLLGIEVVAIAFPAWAYTLMSDLPQQIDPTGHYQSPLLPFLFFGSAVGLRRILMAGSSPSIKSASENLVRRKAALGMLIVVSSQLYLPSTWARLFDPAWLTLNQHSLLGHELIKQLPRDGFLAAQEEFFIPLFVERRGRVFDFSPGVDYRHGVDYLFGDSTRRWYGFQQASWEQWRASGFFETVIDQDGYFLLHRKTGTDPSRQFDDGWAMVGFAEKPNPFMRQLDLQFQNSLAVIGYTAIPSQTAKGGEDLHLILESRALKDISDSLIFLLQIQDEQGHAWAESGDESSIPTPGWKLGEVMRDHYILTLSRIMPPGDYQITLGIWNPKSNLSLGANDSAEQSKGLRPVIGKIHVEKDTRSFTADMLAIEQPLHVDIGEVRYLGSTDIPSEIAAGQKLAIGLYWRARAQPRGDYGISIQLRDSAGHIAVEQTQQPAAGAYPTLLWQTGEILLDWHDLAIPSDIPPASYTVSVILRNRANHSQLGQVDIGRIQIKK